MAQDRAWRLDDLADQLPASNGSVWQMLHDMGYRKVASRYVPHILTCAQKQARVDKCYEHDPNFLHRVVAIDETWLRSYDPKDPKSAAEWRLPTERR
jgi:hypothetical protein